jgi:hypothetical protein
MQGVSSPAVRCVLYSPHNGSPFPVQHNKRMNLSDEQVFAMASSSMWTCIVLAEDLHRSEGPVRCYKCKINSILASMHNICWKARERVSLTPYRGCTTAHHACCIFSVRIWPQKSGLFQVSTAPKPTTRFRVEHPGVTRWKVF